MKNIIKKENYMALPLVLIVLCIIVFNPKANADESKIPEPFRGSDPGSSYSISYDDYTAVLRFVVLDVGRSTRQRAPKAKAKIGTRMKASRKAYTAMEGNRISYGTIKAEDNLDVITSIRKSLERVPSEIEMKLLNNNEQLAYWLNLYNIALIEAMTKVYPKTKVEDALYDDDGILDEKMLNVAGLKLSLNDIHHTILTEKFGSNPLIMYGLHQASIGGPSIRRTAFTGKNVLRQLESNAEEFINSNRGTFVGKKGTLRISTFYDVNKRLFKNFEDDLRAHLVYYADSSFAYEIENAKRLKANIEDWSINDLTGGYKQRGGGGATNSAALLDSATAGAEIAGSEGSNSGVGPANLGAIGENYASVASDFGRFSPDVIKMLQAMKKRGEEREGQVIIKDDNSQ